MFITATELKMNLGKYLALSKTQDIFITKKGKVIAKFSNPNQGRVELAKSLFGVLDDSITLEQSKRDRLDSI